MPVTDDRAPAAARTRRPWSTSGWLLLVALVVFAFGLIASRPPAPPEDGPPTGDVLAAQNAIEALVHPGPAPTALALLPKDFAAEEGSKLGSLAARDGTVRAVHTDGGCSAPWGDDNTKWDYSVPCKAHDLGYDLLRYADKKGHPLAPDIRAQLDAQLSADMHHTCVLNPLNSETTCQVVASLYSAGLVANSWHQRWGPPVGDPIGPMVAGVLVIGCLLVFRLRGWLATRRLPREERVPAPAAPVGRWALLGAASAVVLLLGESVSALADWAGAPDGALWPLTWAAQLAPLVFFAGGHLNAAGWQAERASGRRYRHYLAERSSPLLRPALIFAVVALLVPLGLELLGIPAGTTATVMRIALHPLWLLGVYLLMVVAAPALLALHRRAPGATVAGLLGLVVAGELLTAWTGSSLPKYAATFGIALLAQQLAFAHADGVRPSRRVLGFAVFVGFGSLAVASVFMGAPPLLLGSPGGPAALSAPPWAVLLLGVGQLGLLGLLAKPLARLGQRKVVAATARLALRAPMSLYLVFLAAMLVLVAAVYHPRPLTDGLSWLLGPRLLVAVGLLAVPAVCVFWWFERHGVSARPRTAERPGRRTAVLTRAAATFGIGYAVLGVFGFALARFGDAAADADLLGLRLDPIQSLVHLLLGVFLLHAVRTGTCVKAGTWVACALACAPSLLFAADGDTPGALGVTLHAVTAVFAVAAAIGALLPVRPAVTASS